MTFYETIKFKLQIFVTNYFSSCRKRLVFVSFLLAAPALLNFYPVELSFAHLPKVGFHRGFEEDERSVFNKGGILALPAL